MEIFQHAIVTAATAAAVFVLCRRVFAGFASAARDGACSSCPSAPVKRPANAAPTSAVIPLRLVRSEPGGDRQTATRQRSHDRHGARLA